MSQPRPWPQRWQLRSTPAWPSSTAGSPPELRTSFRVRYGFPKTTANFDAPVTQTGLLGVCFYLKIRQGLHTDTIQTCSF